MHFPLHWRLPFLMLSLIRLAILNAVRCPNVVCVFFVLSILRDMGWTLFTRVPVHLDETTDHRHAHFTSHLTYLQTLSSAPTFHHQPGRCSFPLTLSTHSGLKNGAKSQHYKDILLPASSHAHSTPCLRCWLLGNPSLPPSWDDLWVLHTFCTFYLQISYPISWFYHCGVLWMSSFMLYFVFFSLRTQAFIFLTPQLAKYYF